MTMDARCAHGHQCCEHWLSFLSAQRGRNILSFPDSIFYQTTILNVLPISTAPNWLSRKACSQPIRFPHKPESLAYSSFDPPANSSAPFPFWPRLPHPDPTECARGYPYNRNGKLQKFFIFLLTDCSFCGIISLAVRKHPLHAEPMRWVSMDVTWVAKPRNRIT